MHIFHCLLLFTCSYLVLVVILCFTGQVKSGYEPYFPMACHYLMSLVMADMKMLSTLLRNKSLFYSAFSGSDEGVS